MFKRNFLLYLRTKEVNDHETKQNISRTSKIAKARCKREQRYGTRQGSSFLKFHSSRIFISLPIEYSLDYFNYCKYISNISKLVEDMGRRSGQIQRKLQRGSLDRFIKQLLFLVPSLKNRPNLNICQKRVGSESGRFTIKVNVRVFILMVQMNESERSRIQKLDSKRRCKRTSSFARSEFTFEQIVHFRAIGLT